MAKFYEEITEKLQGFIAEQKIFFVATAGATGRVNLSPKGMDSFRVLDENKVIWLNFTGSGNESAAHVVENGRMTIMFCAFEGKPLILRLYGQAKVIHPRDEMWTLYNEMFPDNPGHRQIFEVAVDLVQTSCGFGVPNYAYEEDRTLLIDYFAKKGEAGTEKYWAEKNSLSIDGKPTFISAEVVKN